MILSHYCIYSVTACITLFISVYIFYSDTRTFGQYKRHSSNILFRYRNEQKNEFRNRETTIRSPETGIE